MANVSYRFLPWARQGLAAALEEPDLDRPLASVARFEVQVPVLDAPGGEDPEPVERSVALHGPGDVVGLQREQVIRTWPAAGATDAEPNYFPLIELDRPDLPWLFTPAAANAAQRLRPWLALVVFEQGGREDDARLRNGAPLSRVEVPDGAAWQLPDLAESWLWAHAQVIPGAGEDDAAALAGDPRGTLSRLLCPRRLRPDTHYLACLVPAFDAGRKAGLGETLGVEDEGLLEAAFAPEVATTLPVYFHWTFATGGEGDFESLARRLRGRPLPEGVGRRPLDVSHPGAGMPTVEDLSGLGDERGVLGLDGALRRPGATPSPWRAAARDDFVEALTVRLNTPARLAAAGPEEGGEAHTVAPPIYGGFHAVVAEVDESAPPWLRELNLDPRDRVAAGMGTEVVQANQEELMERAWRQLGEILAANRKLRQAQLARAATGPVHSGYLSRLPAAELLAVTAGAHTRVRGAPGPGGTTLAAKIRASRVPGALLSAPFRRLTRARGPLTKVADNPRAGVDTLAAVASGAASPRPSQAAPDGTLSLSSPLRVLGEPLAARTFAKLEGGAASASAAARLEKRVKQLGGPRRPLAVGTELRARRVSAGATSRAALNAIGVARPPRANVQLNELAEGVRRSADRVLGFADAPLAPLGPDLPLADARAELLAALDPERTVAARYRERLTAPARQGVVPEDPLAPVMACPILRDAMYAPLRDRSDQWLLPGLDAVPADTATLVETNPALVAAYMVGLNHEMARELVWREFLTDGRGTVFKRFWGRPEKDDIGAVHRFDGGLADNVLGGAEPRLVLLVRSELLHRYPGAIVYAAQSHLVEGELEIDEESILRPEFRGTLRPDTTFIGFDLKLDDVLGAGAPDWWFVIAEQPSEPRFGLDQSAAREPGAAGFGWGDLAWPQVAPAPDRVADVTHAPLHAPRLALDPPPEGIAWGRDSAAQAHITFQHPVRVALRARALLEAPAEGGDGG